MKKILFLLFLLLISGSSFAQVPTYPASPTPTSGSGLSMKLNGLFGGDYINLILNYSWSNFVARDSVWKKTQADGRFMMLADTFPGKFMTTYAANNAISGIASSMGNYVLKIDSNLAGGYPTYYMFENVINTMTDDINDHENRIVNDSLRLFNYTPKTKTTSDSTVLQSQLAGKQVAGSYLTSYTETDPLWHSDSSNYYKKTAVDNLLALKQNSLGFTPYNATNPSGYISGLTFAGITSKPTTLSGYGITDAYPLLGNPSSFLTGINSSQVAAALTYTPVTNACTLTINGTGFDLSANRSWTIPVPDSTIYQTKYRADTSRTNLYAGIAAKFTTPTGTTSQYVRGDGTLAITPVISGATGSYGVVTVVNGLITGGKRVEPYSGTTNGSGVYTVTFGTAFSVAPNIQANLVGNSTNQYLRVASISTTGFTVNAYSFNTNTLLGIVSLINTTANLSGAAVDVVVTEK